MKNIIFRILLISTLILSCNDKDNKELAEEPKIKEVRENVDTQANNSEHFAHVVYFWLNNPDSEDERSKFLKSLQKFIDQSPNIHLSHIGTPPQAERDVVDDSFTYSLVTIFKDRAAHDKYQIEPAHETLRQEIGPFIERFIVYDSNSVQD